MVPTSMRLPLLQLERTLHNGVEPLSPLSTPRVTLPHFARANGELHRSPRRFRPETDDALKTPIDLTIDDIRHVTTNIHASLGRMNQTQELFERESAALRLWLDRIHADQDAVVHAYKELFHHSAIQLQRVFRGFAARRMFHNAVALRATLRIQRAFRAKQARRAERRRNFRILSKKILRGMKGIRAHHDLSHNELLTRVSHNMMIERQWRLAIGVADTESDLMNALYRRKFIRQRLSRAVHQVKTMSAVVRFWQRLVPQRPVVEADEGISSGAQVYLLHVAHVAVEMADEAATDNEQATPKCSLFSISQQLQSPVAKIAKSPTKSSPRVVDRQVDLRRKQKIYTQKVHEDNLKKEAARATQIEKQRELARLAEQARKLHEEEQRRLRLEQAQVLRDDLDRRGLLAIKELQSRKEEALRKEEEVQQRIAQAKQRIAKEVLSDETQVLLARKQTAVHRTG